MKKVFIKQFGLVEAIEENRTLLKMFGLENELDVTDNKRSNKRVESDSIGVDNKPVESVSVHIHGGGQKRKRNNPNKRGDEL
jgi:hypothetical protein